MNRWLAYGLLCVAAVGSANAAGNQDEAFLLLQRMANAAHQLNYSGSFVYQHGQSIETSQITHMKDAGGEYEKLDMMNGHRRQVFRNKDEVYCFLADDKTVMVDKRHSKRSFPALLSTQLVDINKHYDIQLGGQARVAGRDSQVIVLTPKDAYRYGHRLWADKQTGLLLKASIWNDQQKMVDQFFFSDIKIGAVINRKEVKPDLRGKKLVRSTGEDMDEDVPIDPGWNIAAPPPGFKHMMAIKRVLPGAHMPVNHVVFSDGLAAVSVFIEPASEKTVPGLSSQGAVHVYTRIVADHQITVLGEVPTATVVQIGDAVTFKPQ
jgi:sigma-E factor negative regulatory protein RseB